jgi:hypothetical protein
MTSAARDARGTHIAAAARLKTWTERATAASPLRAERAIRWEI